MLAAAGRGLQMQGRGPAASATMTGPRPAHTGGDRPPGPWHGTGPGPPASRRVPQCDAARPDHHDDRIRVFRDRTTQSWPLAVVAVTVTVLVT